MSTTNKKISDLKDIDLHSKIYVLVSDLATPGSYRSGRVSFHNLSSNIYNYSQLNAQTYANEQDDKLKEEIKKTTDSLLANINILDRQITNINNIKIPYVSEQVDTLSNGILRDLRNLSVETIFLSNKISGDIDNIVNRTTTKFKQDLFDQNRDAELSIKDVYNYIDPIITTITNDINALGTKTDNISSIVRKELSVYATDNIPGLIKTGYVENAENKNYPVKTLEDGNAYVHVPWTGGSGEIPSRYDEVIKFLDAGKRTVEIDFNRYSTLNENIINNIEPTVNHLDDQINNGEQITFNVQNYDLISYDDKGSISYYIGKNDTLVETLIINAEKIDTTKSPPTYSIDGIHNIEAREYDVIKLNGQDTYQVCQMLEPLQFKEKSCVVAINIDDDKKSYDAHDIKNSIVNQLDVITRKINTIVVTADVTCNFIIPPGTVELPSTIEVELDVKKEKYYPVKVIVGKLPADVQNNIEIDHHTYIYDTKAYLTLKNTTYTSYSSVLTANILYMKVLQ